MLEIELVIHPGVTRTQIETAIEATCDKAGLTMISKGDLGKYPGCTHWHFKNGKATGTLEFTHWPQTGRTWIAVHHNRRAEWMDDLIPQLKLDSERLLTDKGNKPGRIPRAMQ
ncbi:MAG: hypothetical protein KIS80_05470 [Anaerolineales bacterium]|nr:hypothetical protein [Anaerolineales bacterium]